LNLVTGLTSPPQVRILDSPGFSNTLDTQKDAIRNKSIVAQIKTHIDSVTAVLVAANGTVPRGTGGLHCVLSTLSEILLATLSNKTAFIFTNVANPLSWNFCQDTLPERFRGAPQFRIDNPVALQKKYLKSQADPKIANSMQMTKMRRWVTAGEQAALKMLVELFDWLDGRERHPETEVVSPYEGFEGVKAEIPTLAQMGARVLPLSPSG